MHSSDSEPLPRNHLADIAFGLAWVIGCGAVSALLEPYAQLEDLAMVHVLGIVFGSLRLPPRRAMAMAALCIASFDFVFVPPKWAFAGGDLKNIVTLGAMFVVGVVVSGLSQRVRRQERLVLHAAAREREQFLEAEAERMRSSILSSVSHDLKTPLASIIAAGTTLLRGAKQMHTGEQEVLLRAIVNESERLARIIQNLLSITRLESPTITLSVTPEAIDEIVTAALDRMGPRFAAERVRLDVAKELPLVNAEPALLELVLCNLLENAVRYTPEGSPIDISATPTVGGLRVCVSDRGPGLPEEQRERVFEKFQRGSNARTDDGGIGLGLAICRAIVNAHGGTIRVLQREGGGLTAEVTLPLAPSNLTQPTAERKAS